MVSTILTANQAAIWIIALLVAQVVLQNTQPGAEPPYGRLQASLFSKAEELEIRSYTGKWGVTVTVGIAPCFPQGHALSVGILLFTLLVMC